MATAIAKDRGGEWGVLLLAHGAPDRLEDIPEFLLNVRSGRKLPEAAVNEIVRRYGLIGGSPLLRLSTLQAEGLAMPLGRPVYLGMRNWKPFISEAIQRINADGIERIVALCPGTTKLPYQHRALQEGSTRGCRKARAQCPIGFHRELARSPGADRGVSRKSCNGAGPRAV